MRRIISGFNESDQSEVLVEDEVESIIPYEPFPCFQLQNLFYTEDKEQNLKTAHNNTDYDINLPPGAFRFLKMTMPTKKQFTECLEKAGEEVPEDWTKYNLHATDSADYIYVLSGKIDYVVGETVTTLKKGDFLAQIGPEHTWVNRYDEPCEVLCVMVGMKPTGKAKKMLVE